MGRSVVVVVVAVAVVLAMVMVMLVLVFGWLSEWSLKVEPKFLFSLDETRDKESVPAHEGDSKERQHRHSGQEPSKVDFRLVVPFQPWMAR